MRSLALLSIALAGALGAPATKWKRDDINGFDYNSQLVRGVNLGGWFLLEAFITPSLFTPFGDNPPVDEYNFCKTLGKDECSRRLQEHWASWITESDIKQIADWGFNHVRIPVGYWAFQTLDGDPYVQGQLEYLDQALEWVSKHGLHAWVDIHGAPGSQNGFDNSGLRDHLDWQNGNNVDTTLSVIGKAVDRYKDNKAVTAIELLNEPLGPSLDMNKIKQFFQDGYQQVRDETPSTGVVIHDAFQPIGSFNDFMQPNDYWNVILDHHQYQVFNVDQLKLDGNGHVQAACQIGWDMHGENLWRITGEWSGALTDCTKWLNGVGRGARYDTTYQNSDYIGSCDGINDINTWSDQKKADTRKFIEAQMEAYDQGNGWIFWTYKTEDAIEWSVRDLIQNGLFPQPFDNRQYQNICGF